MFNIYSWITLLAVHLTMDSLSKLGQSIYVHSRDQETKSPRTEDDIEPPSGQPVMRKKADLIYGFLVFFLWFHYIFLIHFKVNQTLHLLFLTSVYKEIMRKAHTHTGLASVWCKSWVFYASTLPVIVWGIWNGTIIEKFSGTLKNPLKTPQ